MRVRKHALLLRFLTLVAAVAACSIRQSTPPPTEAPTEQPSPSATPVQPTPTDAVIETPTGAADTVPDPGDTTPVQPSPTRASLSTPRPAQATRIELKTGATSKILTSHVEAGGVQQYVLRAREGQTIEIVVEAPEQVGLTIVGADGIPLKRYVDEARTWCGQMPDTQDYVIAVDAIEATTYTLTVSLASPAGPTESPEPASIEILSPNGGEEWVEGSTRTIVWTASGVGQVDIAVASGGKPLGHVALGVDANLSQLTWNIPVGLISDFGLAESDRMRVRISSSEDPSRYDENDQTFTVQCLRIRFDPGSTSARMPGTLDAGGDRFRYVLAASAGQTMEIEIWPTDIRIDVWGVQDGSTWECPMGQGGLNIPSLPVSQDYFVTLTSPSGAEEVAYTLDIVIR